jgi:hypothetical protein
MNYAVFSSEKMAAFFKFGSVTLKGSWEHS